MNAFLKWMQPITILGYLMATMLSIQGRAFAVAPTNSNEQANSIIDFRDQNSIKNHHPIIVAHRGGVVTKSSPECSLTAISSAAEQGYDMVELDIQMSSDGIPIVFHDRSLKESCGQDGRVADMPATQLESISYLNGNDRIARLATAFELCHRLKLGVMLDLKAGRDSQDFLQSIDKLLVQNHLEHATISISGSESARRHLRHVRFTPTDDEMRRLRSGESLDLSHRFWFGLPQHLQAGDVSKLKSAGALIIPAINTFRYPAEGHFELARKDIERLMKQNVDGFQIDSIYFPLFDKKQH